MASAPWAAWWAASSARPLIFAATSLATVAKSFSSFEYFWIAILGLTAGIFASSGSSLKALVSLLIGVLLATVGIDPTLGSARCDFGNPNLLGGLNYIVAMIGLFGFSEVLQNVFARRPTEDRVVLAGTSSNNAAVASAWIPALALGLPGDTTTAIVLGVFLMKGITPGPMLFIHQPELVWALFGAFLIANVVLLPVFGFMTANIAAFVVRIPVNLLLGVIAGLCVVGAYAINNNPFDVAVMVGMGAFAFVLRMGGFPLAQVVLGMVLGPILEQSFMVSAIKSRWNLMAFFDRPIAIGLMLATIVIIIVGLRIKGRAARAEGA